MIELRLYFKRQADGTFQLKLSNGFRLVFLTLSGFTAAAMIGAATFSGIGLALVLITAGGALFDESWTWHPESGRLERRIGLLFAYRRYLLDPSDIMAVELRRFASGHKHQRLVRLNLEHGKTGTITLECHRLVPGDNLEEAAHAIAFVLGKPLIELDA